MRSFPPARFVHLQLIFVLVAASWFAGCAKKTPPSDRSMLTAQDAEFRAMWVTTAYNIDWPSKPGLHRRVLRDEIAATIQRAKDLNCNVILLQTRAFCDRMHRQTSLRATSTADANNPFIYADEPWAIPLNWTNDPDTGSAPDFDPFYEWLDQCNVAGIELHAWINPFRTNRLIKVTRKTDKKEFFLPVVKWEKQLYLDPNSKAVQDYVKAVITDFLDHYRPEPDMLATTGVGKAKVAMMMATDDGPDGGVYDHQIPGPPPTTGPGGGDGTLQLMAPAAEEDTRSVGEKRVDWLLKVYEKEDPHLPHEGADIDEFLTWSFNEFTGRGGRFGVSPDETDSQGHFMPLLKAGKVDYVIPELYGAGSDAAFRKALQHWLDAVPQQPDPPIIVAGLYTLRTQTPPDPDDEPWDPKKIEDQMEQVRLVRGANGRTKALGEAHYSAGALRTPDQGGHAEPEKNIAKRLKADRYHEARLAPPGRRAGNNPLPEAPTVEVRSTAKGEVAEWEPAAGGRRPKRYAVQTRTRGRSDFTLHLSGKDGRSMPIKSDVVEIRVYAVDKFNRPSKDYGSWVRP